MTLSRASWGILAVLLLAVPPMVWAAAPAAAQDLEDVEDAETGEEQPQAGDAPEQVDIDALLEAELDVLAGGGATYDPGERRDPFKSLITREQDEARGPRPEGIPGLLIDELALTGIFMTPTGPVAQVRAADRRKSYLLREGDELFDGDVVSISRNELVLKQIVSDPKAIKPFLEVVKRLVQEEDAAGGR